MSATSQVTHRILVIDDNLSIHEDFQRIFVPEKGGGDLDADAAALFDEPIAKASPLAATGEFSLATASQGQDGRALVAAAREAGEPFALAFVDMRMPPGWDGLTTIQKLWEVDPELHVVICTAHSDRGWDEIAATLPFRDRWAVMKKPFDRIEVLQLAHVMTAKWSLMRGGAAQV